MRPEVNEGIRRSLGMSLLVFLAAELISILSVFLFVRGSSEMPEALFAGSFVGDIVAPVAGLMFGGSFVIRHFVIRMFLWENHSLPFRCGAFLEFAKQLLFLRRIGGGYIFTHRLLRDYLASLPSQPEKKS
jgi:hypothetical protein